jgi:peptidyl-prolyl cis-trans isomerase C
MFVAGWWIVFSSVVVAADPVPVATVNGHTLTDRDLNFLRLLRGIDDRDTAGREALIQQLVDRQLIWQFLDARKIVPPADLVDVQWTQLEELIRRRDGQPDAVLAKLGLTADQIRRELGLSPAWQTYVEQTVTAEQLRAYFAEHRPELDGTRVRVLHLFRKATMPADMAAAEKLLQAVRNDIEQKRTTFAAAVKQHSQSPSADEGGDVGWIVGRGTLPDELTTAALRLSPGQLAGPIRSPFGVHLIQVTDRQPGQLSLEDARPQILIRFADQLWAKTVADERARAKIVISPKK